MSAPRAAGATDRPLVLANLSRRGFLQGMTAAGGFVLAAGFTSAARAADPPKYGADGMPNGWVDDPLVFVAIAPDGIVSITCHRSEMGQGVRTGMPMIVADELEADWKRVRVVQAPGDEKRFGNQDIDGSRSTRHFFEPMRRCGAAARTMLEAAAAKRWGVPVSEVEARNHEVVHAKSGRRLGYGALAKDAAQQPVPARDVVRLKDPSKFRYIGKAQYGIDTRLPGMLYAVVARPPVYGGKVVSVDAAEALKVPGVLKVVGIDASPAPAQFNPVGGVAEVASNTWAAIQGRRALKVVWNDGPNGSYDSVAFKAAMEESARKPGKVVRDNGNVDAGMASAAKKIEAEYYIPHLAHAPMEPPAATVRITGTKAEVWGCFQSPQATKDLVAKRLGLQPADVDVHVTLLGGGFGRKSKPDFAIEAAVVSKAMEGKPVKLTWTRGRSDAHLLPHGVGGAPGSGRGRAGQAGGLDAPQRGADALLDLRGRRQERARPRAWDGRHQRAVRHRQYPHREPGGRRAHAHRLVPRGLQYPARLRGAVLRGRGGRPRPEGLSARDHRPGAADHAGSPVGRVESRRVAGQVPGRHRPAAARGRDGRT
jgi:isoquinoline 1-oxidoreductase beta subunit